MKAGIVGANGYGGIELIRLLHHHPMVSVEMLISHSTSGQLITDQYPHLQDILELPLQELSVTDAADKIDILFFATPAGVAKKSAPPFVEEGIMCIDLSGDFRLKDPDAYIKWYKMTPAEERFLQHAVYGLPEIYREKLINKTFVSNPGCYPTAALLGIYPAIKAGIICLDGPIIIDGKTGISGAGRKPATGSLFSEANENTKAYKLGEHQHTPEIEQVLADIIGNDIQITFSTHLVPMTRGILCTIYAPLSREVASNDVQKFYADTYRDEPFVRVRPVNNWPGTKEVSGTNYCDIGVSVDKRSNMLTIIAVIDNLVKGAAGQAIQNMNLLNNWDETTGLEFIGVYP